MNASLVDGAEEVGLEVLLGEGAVVQNLERLDAGEDEVLGDLAAEAPQAGDEDPRGAQPLLRVQPPEADLAVVQLRLVLRNVGAARRGHHGCRRCSRRDRDGSFLRPSRAYPQRSNEE